jgi:hypothetical protein
LPNLDLLCMHLGECDESEYSDKNSDKDGLFWTVMGKYKFISKFLRSNRV